MGPYLSLLTLNPMSREVNRDISDVSDMHRTIMRAFPDREENETPRAYYGVLYRLEVDRRLGRARLYVQSNIAPSWDTLPLCYTVDDGVSPSVAVKSVREAYARITEGMRLRFRLRANPTRKIDTKTGPDGRRRHGRRVPVRGEAAQKEWLERRGKQHGFSLQAFAVTSSGSPELVRSRRPQRTFQGVVYDGTLTVDDEELFRQALNEGIGPGKAFGFGLLSIAPE